MGKTLWVDIETTGLNEKSDQIIELACIYKDIEFHSYCFPSIKPDNFKEIEDLTGITWEFLEAEGIKEEELFQRFIFFLNGIVNRYNRNDKLIIAGYNVIFDKKFIRELFIKNNSKFYGSYFYSVYLDVVSEVAKSLSLDNISQLSNYKLETICRYLGIEFQAHSAIEDIKATIKLYNILNKENNKWTKEDETQTRGIEISLVK